MFGNRLRLFDSVGSDRPVGPLDTLNTKMALRSLGRYETPDYGMTPYPDAPMFESIGKIQKDKKLHFDRMMFPGGETEQAINNELKQAGILYPDDGECHSVPGFSACIDLAEEYQDDWEAETDPVKKGALGLKAVRKMLECDDLCQAGSRKPAPPPRQPEPGV